MQAWKCDRCGKLYSTFAERGKEDVFKLKGVSVIRIGCDNPDVYESQRIDVCEDCAKSFILWFKEPALAAITNEGY